MKSKHLLSGLFLSLLGLSATAAWADPEIYIKDFRANGDGCPPGSYASILTDNNQTLQILYSQFIAELAPAGTFVQHTPTSACTVSLKVHLPPGISLSWYRTEHRGFADTSNGSRGQFWARYYLPGQGGFDTVRIYNINPGTVADYTVVNDNLGGSWTACGGDQLLSVNTRVRLYGTPNGFDTMTVDDQTQRVETLLRFRYQSCI